MTSKDWLQVIIAILMGVGLWVYGYLWHKERRAPGPSTYQLFYAPCWLVRLSGRPGQDNRLEVGAVILQVAGLFLLVVPFVMVILEVDFDTRAIIIFLVPLSLMIVGLCARVLLAIARR